MAVVELAPVPVEVTLGLDSEARRELALETVIRVLESRTGWVEVGRMLR